MPESFWLSGVSFLRPRQLDAVIGFSPRGLAARLHPPCCDKKRIESTPRMLLISETPSPLAMVDGQSAADRKLGVKKKRKKGQKKPDDRSPSSLFAPVISALWAVVFDRFCFLFTRS